MLKKIIMCALIALGLNAAQSEQGQVIKGFEKPESVFVGKDFIFVGNQSFGKPADKKGFVSKLSKSGELIKREFVGSLKAPRGMAEFGGTLFVVDDDALYGFDTASGRKNFELQIKNESFLNDVVALSEQKLLVSSTSSGIIYELDLKTMALNEFVRLDLAKFGGGNGLLLSADKRTLYAACFHPDFKSGGVVISVDLKSKKIAIIDEKKGAYDGIAWAQNGDLLVSEWGENLQGVIHSYDPKSKTKSTLKLPLMKGPADIFSDVSSTSNGAKLYIPKMLENEVLIVPLP